MNQAFKRIATVFALAIALVASGLSSSMGTASAQGAEVMVAPPAVIVEHPGRAPGPRYYWRAGYWSWVGGRWAWVHGTYVVRPAGRTAWVAGRWVVGPHGHYHWVAGYWR